MSPPTEPARPAARTPFARSWPFTILATLLVFHTLTGAAAAVLGRQGGSVLHYAVLRAHVAPWGATVGLVVVLTAVHLGRTYGPWAGVASVGIAVAGVVIIFGSLAVATPLGVITVVLPLVLWGLYRLVSLRPRTPVAPSCQRWGPGVAVALWFFCFIAVFTYLFGKSFYGVFSFRTEHSILGALALGALVLHVRAAGRRRGPGDVPVVLRVSVIAAANVVLVAATLADARRLGALFEAAPATAGYVAAATFPARYDLREARVGHRPQPDPLALLIDSASCAASGCHDDLYAQWAVSSHRHAAITRPYRKVIEVLADELGPAATHTCSKCHAPALALAGLADDPADRSLDPLRAAGVGCQWCHSIVPPADGAPRSNGELALEIRADHGYTMKPRSPEGTAALHDYVRLNMSGHRHVYHFHRRSKSEEECVPCHRLVAPDEWPGAAGAVLRDFHATRAAPVEGEPIECAGCHMILARYDHPKHARPDHRTPGTNNALSLMVDPRFPVLGDLTDLDRTTEDFLGGERYQMPHYEHAIAEHGRATGDPRAEPDAYSRYLLGNRKITVELAVPPTGSAGAALPARVVVANQTGAHVVPSGPLDLNEYWIELVAVDERGTRLFESGVLTADRRLPAGTVTLGGTLLDRAGRPIDRHRIWQVAEVRADRVIEVGERYEHVYEIPVPADARGTVTLRAAVHYRRYGQDFADWVYDADGTTFPVYTFSQAEAQVLVDGGAPAAARGPAVAGGEGS